MVRSRLEARWAVFFDEMGWKYDYEAEGYKLNSGFYLPDFYFPEINIWAEVKPTFFTDEELLKCIELSAKMNSNKIGVDVILLNEKPSARSYSTIINGNKSYEVILVGKSECYYPFYQSESYNKNNHFLDQTNKAIRKANEARFEFEWKEVANGRR